jgi:imidazoleglycerol phosphate synthase glutamine amidotransferase subunit HisH
MEHLDTVNIILLASTAVLLICIGLQYLAIRQEEKSFKKVFKNLDKSK